MGYTEVMKDVSTAYDNAVMRGAYDGRTSADGASKEPINFGDLIREKYSEGTQNTVSHTSSQENATYFTGASLGVTGAAPQIKEIAFPDELDQFGEPEDLDSAISFDEISELDDITDTEAAKIAELKALDKFNGFDELSDAMSSEEDEEEDLSMFSDFEEII